jgi:methionine-rich copper-binding protein CopC
MNHRMSISSRIGRRARTSCPGCARGRIRHRRLAGVSIELLEVRSLLSTSPLAAPLPEHEPNDTLDLAQDLGTPGLTVAVAGSIGDGPAGAADVDWYHFHLDQAARVDLEVGTPAGSARFPSILSLYDNDPQDLGDPYDFSGHRRLAQIGANSSDGVAEETRDLGPGDYFVAVSGAGNHDFSPWIAGSGYDGATGAYVLTVHATDLGLSADGPTVLSSDPAAGAILTSSPLAIRLGLSGPLDAATIVPGQTVQLVSLPDGGAAVPIALASVNFSAAANELQLFPLAPLEPGHYRVQLAGDADAGQAVLAAPDGVPLGRDGQHPAGADESVTFQVDGIDGVAGATGSDDTPSTARDLGGLAGTGLVQVDGAIGVDPSFNPGLAADPTSPDPQFNPANQVDLYHFRITGPGRYVMLAEVFADRIGSPLDPGISLWERSPGNGAPGFLAGNNNTLNPTQGSDGSSPLFTDSALSFSLTAGDYFLAVAGGSNTPSPLEGQAPGSPGLFDPNQPGSAQLGWSTGPYVLNLLVEPARTPPEILATSPAAGQVLDAAPTQLTVRFSEPMDLQQLAFQAFESTYQTTLGQVFVEGPDGTKYYPRFESFDRATNQATFRMLDGLANGSYTLHLSGPAGLADLAGNPILGNDPSGDDVIPFQVQGPDRGVSGNMTDGYTLAARVGSASPQDLGVLFPDELQAGLTISRGPESGAGAASASTEDDYVIQFLQNQYYSFVLSGDALPDGTRVTLTDAQGQAVPLLSSPDGRDFFGPVKGGTYTVAVGGWTAGQSAGVAYKLTLNLTGQQDNAPPLMDGPSPALQIHLEGFGALSGPMPSASPEGDGVSGSVGGGSVGGGSVGGGSVGGGSVAVSVPGLAAAGSSFAPHEAMGTLAGLGMGPLGGAGGVAGPAFAQPIQVALGLPAAPVLDRLASLITLTQVIAFENDGLGTGDEAVAPAEQAVARPSDELDSDSGSAGPIAVTSGALDSLDPRVNPVGEADDAGSRVQLGLARTQSRDTVLTDEDRPQERADAAWPAGPMALEGWHAQEPDVSAQDEPSSLARIWVTRLAITGAMIAIAIRARQAVRDLDWRRRARAERDRSPAARPIVPRPHQDSTTATWPVRAPGRGPSPGSRRMLQAAGSAPS